MHLLLGSSRAAPLATLMLVPALAWISLYVCNEWMFSTTSWSDGINWVFLPAAVRLLSVLVCGPLGALGLFLGGLFTMMIVEGAPIEKALPVAAASAIAPLLAVSILLPRLHMQPTLMGMSSTQLAALAAGSAAASVALHNLYYWISDHRDDPVSGLLPMFIGDLIGTVLVLYLLRCLLRMHVRLRSPRSR